jgi:aryl-alcohol dehydrogenase-like predicted oxidoreductase
VEAASAIEGASPAQVAIAWLLQQPCTTAPLLGARTPQQLDDLLKALELELPAEISATLDAVSATKPIFPHSMIGRTTQQAWTRPFYGTPTQEIVP